MKSLVSSPSHAKQDKMALPVPTKSFLQLSWTCRLHPSGERTVRNASYCGKTVAMIKGYS